MVRDIRQPDFVQFVSAEKWPMAEQDVSISFVSTDGVTGLVVLTAFDQKERKDRTVNIYLDRFDGEFCERTVAVEPVSTLTVMPTVAPSPTPVSSPTP
jgi:hypothetical protein